MKPRPHGSVPVRKDPRMPEEVGSEAVRDANEILGRRAADDAEAAAARPRLRSIPSPGLRPDGAITPLLGCDEQVLTIRAQSAIDRRTRRLDDPGVEGSLYLTSRRLVLLGTSILSFPLEDIEDAIVSGDRLLLALRGGTGLTISVDRPRLLRVEIAAARAARRRSDPSRFPSRSGG